MNLEISPATLAQRLAGPNPPRLLDVRRPDEQAVAALAGSLLLPLHELPARLAELRDWREADVVVYCHHGVRSLRAVEFLRESGFKNAVSLAGGIDAWSVQVDGRIPRY